MNPPRVLVVSHNVFSTGNNMGRSLAALLSSWDPASLSQLYFLSGGASASSVPPVFPDHRWGGAPRPLDPASGRQAHELGVRVPFLLSPPPIPPGAQLPERPSWTSERRHVGAGPWHSQALAAWIEEIQPDVLLFARGIGFFPPGRLPACQRLRASGGGHLLRRHLHPSGRLPLRQLHYRLRLRWARRLLAGSTCLLTASRPMSEAYAPYFPSPAGSFTHPISSHPRSIPRLRASGTLAIWGWDAGGSWLPSGGLCALWRFPGSPLWRSTPKRKIPTFCPISSGKTASGFAAASPAAT